MRDKIAIGQYFSGNSFIHSLDPRVKIWLSIIMMFAIFMSWSYMSMAIICLFIFMLILISKVPLRFYIKGSRIILLFALFSAIINLFYGEGEPLYKFGVLTITEYGIKNSIVIMVRISGLLFMSSILMFTTSPNDMTYAIESIMKPLNRFNVDVQDIAMMMTISLRFIPTLFEEFDKIMKAQKSRGADVESSNLIKRVKSYIPILFPLLVSSFRRAYDLAIAMECRCYNSLARRTRMKEFSIGGRDVIAVITVCILLICVSVCSIYKIK